VDQLMAERSRQIILVTDSSKFGRAGFVPVQPVGAFHTIITDIDAPEEMIAAIQREGVEVILV
jgi:DeoR family transcriptional regulator, galactitol utilization operon repressor